MAKNNHNLTFLIIKMVQFQSSANLFVQLLEPDMGILFENRSDGYGPLQIYLGAQKAHYKLNQCKTIKILIF